MVTKSQFSTNLSRYNPDPFGIDSGDCFRKDSINRWSLIKEHVHFEGKLVVDLCCADGYFGFKALREGAKSVLFIDKDPDYINTIKDTMFTHSIDNCYFERKYDKQPCDVLIFLDTLYSRGAPTLEDVDGTFDEMVISPGTGEKTNENMEKELRSRFSKVEFLGNPYEARHIYKVTP